MLAKGRVLVTRERSNVRELLERLQGSGFEPLAVPCLEIEVLPAVRDAAAMLVHGGCWLVVTSATAVRLLVEEFARTGHNAETILGSLSLAAVGERTARALARCAPTQSPILVPPVSNSVALGELLAATLAHHQPPTKLVLCRGVDADAQLPQLLAGMDLSCYSIYRTGVPLLHEHEVAALQLALADSDSPLTILVGSLATGGNLLELVKRYVPAGVERLLATRIIAIGQGTASGLATLGFVQVEAPPTQSLEAMVALI